ncbi:MAG: phenylalanine--tRNA ligase subunit alpha [Candidatus Woesearchaeota archaeon]
MVDVSQLHEYEVVVLSYLLEHKTFDSQKISLDEVQISRALQWLSNKKLIDLAYMKYQVVRLDENGEIAKKQGLPEVRLLKALDKPQSQSQLLKKGFSMQEIGACIGILKQKGAIDVQKGKELIISKIKDIDISEQSFFNLTFPAMVDSLSSEQKDQLESLKKRKQLVLVETKTKPSVKLTAQAKKISLKSLTNTKTINTLTSEMLVQKTYKSQTVRPIDVRSPVPKKHPGRMHPMTAVIEYVRQIFLEMGFTEMKGPWVETAFWCMDSMWIPQDHPARDVQDTFYLNKQGQLPSKELLKKIKQVHEHGAKDGYRGYSVPWNETIAKELVLRTHTTATTYRTLASGVKTPAKYFYIGKVFRNEAIDATHLPEFYQVEGFVMDDDLTLGHLLAIIKEFYAKLGFDTISFKPTYNPYTEPSIEALYFDKEKNKWLELINSGIFRPESLEPYGIKKPVIAWGLGLERLAMLLLEQDKLKDIIGPQCDLEWLKSYKEIKKVAPW